VSGVSVIGRGSQGGFRGFFLRFPGVSRRTLARRIGHSDEGACVSGGSPPSLCRALRVRSVAPAASPRIDFLANLSPMTVIAFAPAAIEDVPAPIGPPPPAPDVPDRSPPAVPPPPPAVDPPAADPPQVDPGSAPPVADPPPGASALGRLHARRLREIHRSAGWPCCDAIEIDLLAARLIERVRSAQGHETLRLTGEGIAHLAGALVVNRAAMSRHEALVEQVAREMTRAGRLAWRGLSLRARLPAPEAGAEIAMAAAPAIATATATAISMPMAAHAVGAGRLEDLAGERAPPARARWCIARPDVFSIRNTSVEAYAQPVVHEVKVSRADLLGDLRKPDKRAAYLDLGGECWYVLGRDARGRPIGEPEEIPIECGVLIASEAGRLTVARPALHRALPRMPFPVWMALAKAQPVTGFDDEMQDLLGGGDPSAWE
jgi:hypothetical protein